VQRQCSGRVLPSWLAGGRATNVRRGHTARPSPRALRPSLSDESGIWGASGAIRSNGGACASNSPPRQPRPLLVERGGVASGWQQPSQATARFSIYLSIYLSLEPSAPTDGLHIHQPAGAPEPGAVQMGELRTAWARAARVDTDASMSRGTAIRTARRAAEATDGRRRRKEGRKEEPAEEQAAAEEEELLLGFI